MSLWTCGWNCTYALSSSSHTCVCEIFLQTRCAACLETYIKNYVRQCGMDNKLACHVVCVDECQNARGNTCYSCNVSHVTAMHDQCIITYENEQQYETAAEQEADSSVALRSPAW